MSNGDDVIRPERREGMLPRLDPALLTMSSYYSCQIAYVIAKELGRTKAEESWVDAYKEGWAFVEALEASGRPPSPNFLRPNEESVLAAPKEEFLVHWPTFICAANSYAQRSADHRAYIRAQMAKGASLWELGMSPTVPIFDFEPVTICDKAAPADADYQPDPPCVPREVATAAGVAVGSFAAAMALALVVRVIRR